MEIERKFLVKNMPNLSGKKSVPYERYYLTIKADAEERVQKKGDIYERESKIIKSNLSRETKREQITKDEFNSLKEFASKAIIRESYSLSIQPDITIKIYHGDYEGLVRAEVEFDTEKTARQFKPAEWMGEEITNTLLARDSGLAQLTRSEFKSLLSSFSSNGN